MKRKYTAKGKTYKGIPYKEVITLDNSCGECMEWGMGICTYGDFPASPDSVTCQEFKPNKENKTMKGKLTIEVKDSVKIETFTCNNTSPGDLIISDFSGTIYLVLEFNLSVDLSGNILYEGFKIEGHRVTGKLTITEE